MTELQRAVVRTRAAMVKHYRAERKAGRISGKTYREAVTPILNNSKTAPERSPRGESRRANG